VLFSLRFALMLPVVVACSAGAVAPLDGGFDAQNIADAGTDSSCPAPVFPSDLCPPSFGECCASPRWTMCSSSDGNTFQVSCEIGRWCSSSPQMSGESSPDCPATAPAQGDACSTKSLYCRFQCPGAVVREAHCVAGSWCGGGLTAEPSCVIVRSGDAGEGG